MKSLFSTAIAAAAMACAFAPTTARANDTKAHHGSDCKVFGATAWTDLNFTGFGVKNIAATNRNIICPIEKDSMQLWDSDLVSPVNFAYVHVHFRAEGAPSSALCTVYTTTMSDTALYNAYPISATSLATGVDWNGSTNGLVSVAGGFDGYHDKAYMLCNLGPGVRLTGYSLTEYGNAE